MGTPTNTTGIGHDSGKGLPVVPRCPFVRSYVERHPEYQSLVAR